MSTMEANHYYNADFHDSEHDSEHDYDVAADDSHVVPWKIGAFLLIPILEVLAQIIFVSDGERAILVGPAFFIVLLIAGFDLISQARLRASDHSMTMRYWFTTGTWLGAVGLFAIALSVAWRNELYFIAADIFHWYIELLGVAFLGVWSCSSYSSLVISRAFSKAFLCMALIGAAVVLLGMAGVLTSGYGGKTVEGFFRWRLELGRGFPLIPLIVAISALLYAPRAQARSSLFSLFSICLLLVCLVYTLKRTQWFLFPVCFVGLILPKRIITMLPFLLVLMGTVLWAFHIVSPKTLPNLVEEAKEMLTYNEDWTIDDTLDNRSAQVEETLKVAAKEWWGHGFGAEIYITTPNGKRVEALHYVHSLYAYYALQFGVFGCLVGGGVFLMLLFSLYMVLDTNADAQWIVRSAIFGIIALAGSGLMMVSLHTSIAGVVLAMSVVGLARCVSPHPADRHQHYHDEEYEDDDEDSDADNAYADNESADEVNDHRNSFDDHSHDHLPDEAQRS